MDNIVLKEFIKVSNGDPDGIFDFNDILNICRVLLKLKLMGCNYEIMENILISFLIIMNI